MNITDRNLQDIIDNEAKQFALYTIQERALPSIMDGLKPVQRFVLYSALNSARRDFKKVASVGGIVSDFGYNHAETSAQSACALMSNTWSNNVPILEGRGNFGSRQVQEASATRYIFCKVHENFDRIFKDNEILPEHPKAEYLIPRYYLPVIPFVLLNGSSGIATGYACEILPHSLDSVVECMRQVLDKGACNEPDIAFPQFTGKVDTSSDKWFIEGTYELTGKTKLTITEIPIRFDRVKYVTLLDSLLESDKIVSYEESKGAGEFTFKVTLKRDFDTSHDNIVKVFKLQQGISQNINVIGPNDELLSYSKASDLIKDFVEFRKPFYQGRIEYNKAETAKAMALALAKVEFISKVLDNTIVVQGKTKKVLVEEIKTHQGLADYADLLVGMSIYTMTDDEIIKLEQAAAKAKKEHEYWLKTTVTKQFKKDLQDL